MEDEENKSAGKGSLFEITKKHESSHSDNDICVCKKCNDTGKILTKNGMQTCFDCLQAGRLDVHSKEVKDTNIRW